MPVLTTALNTNFTPTKKVFSINPSGGPVTLMARNSGDTQFAQVGYINSFTLVDNVVGTTYKLVASQANQTVSAFEE